MVGVGGAAPEDQGGSLKLGTEGVGKAGNGGLGVGAVGDHPPLEGIDELSGIEGEEALVTREVDGGLETERLKLPSVITTDLRLNEPRYASLPNIMKAKKKTIDKLTPAELGVDIAPRLVVLKVEEPAKRQAGIKVKSAAELVEKLHNEARVI